MRMPRVRARGAAWLALVACSAQAPLDQAAQRWVDATLKKLTLEQLVGQLIFAPLNSTYLSSDSDQYEALVELIHEAHVGGVIAFGGTEPVPQVLLNPTYWPDHPRPAAGAGVAAQPAAGGLGRCRC